MKSGRRTFEESRQDYIDKENNQLKNPSKLKVHERITYEFKNKKGESLSISEEEKIRITTDAIKELNQNFHNLQAPNACSVMLGPIEGKMGFAFICNGVDPQGVGYTRIMVKK